MKRLLFLLPLCLLPACSGHEVRSTLGLNRSAPDEFRVVSRPPLSVPREFYLEPPRPGEDTRFQAEVEAEARSLVTGAAPSSSTRSLEARQAAQAESGVPIVDAAPLVSPGESLLLQRVGAAQADPEIRQKLFDENTALFAEEPGILEKLRGEGPDEPVVDAKAEAERIVTNREAGKPVTEGEVPVKDPKQKSVLERVFE